jgi:hypothetical protein
MAGQPANAAAQIHIVDAIGMKSSLPCPTSRCDTRADDLGPDPRQLNCMQFNADVDKSGPRKYLDLDFPHRLIQPIRIKVWGLIHAS